ncbi:MAG: hypothetical protein CMM44_00715 [Rhodospirillaceae bacterium]|nr:hypothetical protein [Rhodospirillaceae bacterium]|tara:strand:- start:7496 stop:7678 length:183 start_codon:yes stop_codon:yes gene_type:complete
MNKLDTDQLQFVEIIAKLLNDHELFKEEYSSDDFERVVIWLKKLRAQIDITIETLGDNAS